MWYAREPCITPHGDHRRARVEGHVPIADMKRVLAAKPKGIRGLAVAGMPLGSPGMQAPGYPADRFNVIAFGSGNTSIFAKH